MTITIPTLASLQQRIGEHLATSDWVLIDQQLADAGWLVQDRKHINLFAGLGIAVREMIMAKGHGRVDYLLYVDKRVVGVI